MHYYEKNIVDIKNIYTDFLLNMISPLIFEGIKSIYTKAITVEQEYQKAMLEDDKITNPGVLKIFQHFLKGIPTLNSNLIESEMVRIRDSSKNADIFDKIIRAVFKSHIILLTYNASGKECLLVKEKYHERIEIKDFIHKIYVESAKHFYNNPELFWHNFPSIDIKKNHLQCIDIIKNSVKEAILKVLPLNDILTEYLRNDYIPDKTVEEMQQINQIRSMLGKEDVINHYDGGSIVNSNDNGVMENFDENIELNERNNLLGQLKELNQDNNQNGGLILNQESLINSQDYNKPENSEMEYQDKLNSLGGAFYHKPINNKQNINQEKTDNLHHIQNKVLEGAAKVENNSDTKINIVKQNIIETNKNIGHGTEQIENKVTNINKQEYYNTMFS